MDLGAGKIINKAFNASYELVSHTHSHPNDDPTPSPGDIGAAGLFESMFKNPIFNILLPTSGTNIPFNGSSTSGTFDDIIVKPTK